MIKVLIFAFIVIESTHALQPVAQVNVGQYAGRWYQLSRNVLDYEPPVCACAQQTLTVNPSGYVDFFSSCNVFGRNGPRAELRGKAYSQDPENNNRFLIEFGNKEEPPDQYWIIALGSYYQWAVISDPTEKSLFIMSRTPTLPPDQYSEALQLASMQVNTDKLKPTKHDGCNYPK